MIITLEEDPITGELILPLPDELMKDAGWDIGDTIQWKDLGDGSWSMTKIPTQLDLPLDDVSEAVAQLWEQVDLLKQENKILKQKLQLMRDQIIGD